MKYGYAFDVVAASQFTSGMMTDLRTAREIKNDLRAARASKKPIPLITPFGETIWGFVTGLTETAQEYEPASHVDKDLLMNVHVTFAEVQDLSGDESIHVGTLEVS